ncbi:MAG: AlpA family transcriptional regulator [Rhodospirillales bacterium]|nr:AlpA family transcriptional regulator [Rhodospirillales bacterium]
MPAQENRILRLPEVMRLTGLSKATIHRRYRDGTFPEPVRLGPQSIGWWRAEILEWLESLQRAGAALDEARKRKAGHG